MTLRESLLKDVDSIVKEYAASRQDTRRMLGGYAIGKWVPVEERLPDDRQTVITRWDNGDVSFAALVKDGKWSLYSPDSKITQWLDLSLPEVES